MNSDRRYLFIVMTAAIVWAGCELIIALALPTIHPPINTMDPRAFIEKYRSQIEGLILDHTDFVAFDPTLGWSHKPWGRGDIYRANGQGLRADRDYTQVPGQGIIRIATFGDSFMLGADVEVEQTWQALLETSNPAFEVPNFGVSSYGTGQAVLRYLKEGKNLAPDIVVLSYIAENNKRNINTFRPFYLPSTGFPLAKPRYRLEGEELILVPNPVQSLEQYQELLDHPETELPRIGQYDAYYPQYLPSKTSLVDNIPSVHASVFWFRRMRDWWSNHMARPTVDHDWYTTGPGNNPLLFRIFDLFHDQAVASGTTPIFLLFPIHFDYRDAGPSGEMPYSFLVPFLEHKGYIFIDCDRVFRPWLRSSHTWSELYAHGNEGGHYSPAAHRLIAAAVEDLIKDTTTDSSTEKRSAPAQSPAATAF